MNTQSSHWYDDEANARHTIIGKNGKERNTTIADARKNNWYPSVSGVIGVLDKGDLSNWKHRQITSAAFITQPQAGEFPEAYHARIMDAAFKQVNDAADLGTRIHAAIENHCTGKPYDGALKPYVDGAQQWLDNNDVRLCRHEMRLVNRVEGFAGTTDAEFVTPTMRGILDWKSRKTKPGNPVQPYDTQVLQIAAYGKTYFNQPFGGVNVYVSTTEIINGCARVEATWYTEAECVAAWDAFKHAAALWRYLKKYDPRKP